MEIVQATPLHQELGVVMQDIVIVGRVVVALLFAVSLPAGLIAVAGLLVA